MSGAKLDVVGARELLRRTFPQVDPAFSIVEVGEGTAAITLQPDERHLRPGGTVSGPTLFALVDLAYYVATMSLIGPEPLTVTTNVSINFMRKPSLALLRADARVLKLGRTLSVGDVTLTSEGVDGPVVHAAVTYAVPPSR